MIVPSIPALVASSASSSPLQSAGSGGCEFICGGDCNIERTGSGDCALDVGAAGGVAGHARVVKTADP